MVTLKPRPVRGFLSLFVSAGIEPGGKCCVGQLAMTRFAEVARFAQSRPVASHRRVGALVVGGFRYNEAKPVVGSLLLGLYDSDGFLHHVGFTSTIPRDDKKALTVKLKKLIAPPGFTGNSPGGPSRWSTGRSAQWQPIKPVLVVEVRYDHFTGYRFRHGTKFLRWRPDKLPRQCTMDQVTQKTADVTRLLT